MKVPVITPQVRKFMVLLSNNRTVPEIAEELKINRRKIEHIIERLRVVCDCKTTVGLIAYFLRNKLIK